MGESFKSLFDGLDKVTDILNAGRLIFYTAAGFWAVLPAAMSLRMLGHETSRATYWIEFYGDLTASTRRPEVWVAALILGFVVATVANVTVIKHLRPGPTGELKPDVYGYAYQYPRLFSGGVKPKDGGGKDYAAWLISEYYRYVEIAVFIPFAILVSLPVYWFYSLLYLVSRSSQTGSPVPNAGHYAFALWTLVSGLAWMVAWPKFWIPRVAEPVWQTWIKARRTAIRGLEDFIGSTEAPAASANQKKS